MFEHDKAITRMHENMITKEYSFNKLSALDIEGIIFDYGATLDTCGNHWGQVIWHAYQFADVPVSESDYRTAYVHVERTLATNKIIMPDFTFDAVLSTKLQMQLAYLRDNKVLDVPQLELDIMHDVMLTYLARNLKRTLDHSRFVLETLRKRYPLVLVSNFYGNIKTILDDYLLLELFEDVIESAVVGVRKPDPKIFALGIETLKLPAEKVMVVGDSFDKDIVPAHALGCPTAWFKSEAWEDKAHDESIPQMIIKDLEDLLG